MAQHEPEEPPLLATAEYPTPNLCAIFATTAIVRKHFCRHHCIPPLILAYLLL